MLVNFDVICLLIIDIMCCLNSLQFDQLFHICVAESSCPGSWPGICLVFCLVLLFHLVLSQVIIYYNL